MLAQMMDFIDNLSTEDHLFWQLGHDPAHAYEIDWKRSERPRPWSLRHLSQEKAQNFSASELLVTLQALKLDLRDFERQVGVSILTQAVFADMVTSAAKQLFGEETVSRSVSDTRLFLDSVKAAAAEHTTTAASKAQLKLVRPSSLS